MVVIFKERLEHVSIDVGSRMSGKAIRDEGQASAGQDPVGEQT